MFKLLRTRAKIFYWIIAVSFILFTFIVWGAQCGRSGGPQQQGPTSIGSINGVKITTAEWDNMYRQYMAQLRDQYQTDALSVNQRALAAETVWQYMLRAKIEDHEIDSRGLGVNDDEIIDVLKNSPPPEILQSFMTDEGQVDMDAYFAELANPERDWTGVEAYLRAILPRQKLMEALTADVIVTDTEMREAYTQQTLQAVAEYVGVLYSELTIETQPTDEEIAAYYADNTADFTEPEKVSVNIVTFPKAPSDLDDRDVQALAVEVRQEILDGAIDFAEAAAIYSEDGTREEGGDLGTFDRERMVDEFTAVAFDLPVGEISAPVKTQFGYHLIEVIEQFIEEDEVARVHARHILFKVTIGDETLSNLYEQALSFRDDALDVGFTEAAEDAALEVAFPRPVHEGRDIPGFRNTAQGSFFAFNSDADDISRVMGNEEFFYVVRNLEYLPEGPSPLADVESQVVSKLNRDAKTALADEKLNPAVGALQMGGAFADVADEFELAHAVTDTFTATGNVADVGYNTDFNQAAVDNAIGALVERIETNRGLFAMKVLWKSDFDEEAYAAAQAELHDSLITTRRAEVVEQWYEDKLSNAKIDDRRYLLYADE
jgi:parvulin-like peptidyl-prolyl isomerase